MAKKSKAATKPKRKPSVHKELQGFEVSIDSFGEIKSNMPIEKLNEFLDKNVDDKKLTKRDDYAQLKKGKAKKKS
jgi:hypothetical protein